MIPRYSRIEMASIWEPENRYRIWLDIEILACEAMEQRGTIPFGVAAAIRERGRFEVSRIDALEKELKHDVLAFLTNVAEHVGDEARFMHQGMTSSDVLDTALAVQLVQATDLLLRDVEDVMHHLRNRAQEHAKTLCMGRSHGIHAEPTSFGLKLAGHYAAFARAHSRLICARQEVASCALSGPVGNFSNLDPFIEAYVAEKLGLAIEPVSTQIIPRDRHAMFFATLAVVASSVENLATEIRHLQRSEVREVEEKFSVGQKGSSAMPHKRNPVLSENLTGLARIVRAAVVPALENVTLWHERDISHSAVERVFAPDATIALDFALVRLANLVRDLVIYPDAMQRNVLSLGGVVFSQRVLLALTQAGMSREAAYEQVQNAAMKVWHEGGQFEDRLAANPQVTKYLSPEQLSQLIDYNFYLQRVPFIIERTLGSNASA